MQANRKQSKKTFKFVHRLPQKQESTLVVWEFEYKYKSNNYLKTQFI